MKYDDCVILSVTKWSRRILFCVVLLAFFFSACSEMGDRDNPFDMHGDEYEAYWGFDCEHDLSYCEDVDVVESSGSERVVVSSSSVEKDTAALNRLSSSRAVLDIDGGDMPSSSSMLFIEDNPVSSSSEAVVVTGLGSCKPTKTPIEKGEATTWTFVPNPAKTANSNAYGAMAFAQATYSWSFGEGLSEAAPGISTASGKVTYANSGKYSATVVASVMNKETKQTETETIECATTLQVNGDPITGCKCSPTVGGAAVTGSVNMQETPEVVWTVAGCTSAAEINSWEWDGVPGKKSFTKTFTAETASYAPKLKVGNNDNTVIDVSCDAVMVVEDEEVSSSSDSEEISSSVAVVSSSSVSTWKCGEDLLRDGVSYKTVTIKEHCWTKENLRYVPSTGNTMCYGDESESCSTYGLLYDYEAASLACPSGWRLPTSDEYVDLQEYSGEDMYDAGAWFKTTSGWTGENGNDELGFSALPGGRCSYAKSCSGLGERGYWWTATEVVKNSSHYTLFLNGDGDTFSAATKMDNAEYVSVRCIKTN